VEAVVKTPVEVIPESPAAVVETAADETSASTEA